MQGNIVIISTICILILTSCQPKNVVLDSVSDNKKVEVQVKANRDGKLDPWKVQIGVKAYDFQKGHLAFELEGGDINDKTVKFEWQGNGGCTISFEQADGNPKVFQLVVDANQVQLAEVNP